LYLASGKPMPESLQYMLPQLPGAKSIKPKDDAILDVGNRIADALEGFSLAFASGADSPKGNALWSTND
jgi:hypothetical protein